MPNNLSLSQLPDTMLLAYSNMHVSTIIFAKEKRPCEKNMPGLDCKIAEILRVF